MKKRKKLSRIQLHQRICAHVGITTKSRIGYLSRYEMVDVLDYLDRVNNKHTTKGEKRDDTDKANRG